LKELRNEDFGEDCSFLLDCRVLNSFC